MKVKHESDANRELLCAEEKLHRHHDESHAPMPFLYRRELIYQEIKSNKSTLKGFIWFVIAVTFVWLLTITGFFQVDKGLVTIAFIFSLVVLIPPFCMLIKGDLAKPWIKYVLLSLICIVSAVIVSFLSFHAVLLYVVPLLFAIQYRRRST